MKIRQGFVSNSSSSSFLVVGKKVKPSDVTLEDFKNKNYMIKTHYSFEAGVNIYTKDFAKDELGDLYDLITRRQIRDEEDEMNRFFNDRVYRRPGDKRNEDEICRDYFIEVIYRDYDSGEVTVSTDKLVGNDIIILHGEEDQHSPMNMMQVAEMIGEM